MSRICKYFPLWCLLSMAPWGSAETWVPIKNGSITFFIPVNLAPNAVADNYNIDEDILSVFDVMANDTDDGDITLAEITIVTEPTYGNAQESDGQVSYEPAENYFGPDSFTYNITDSGGEVSETVAVSITVNPVNDAPVAVDDTATIVEDQQTAEVLSPLVNDSDVDSTSLVVNLLSANSSGNWPQRALSFDSHTQTFSYLPPANQFGDDWFTYSVTDAEGLTSAPATFRISVLPQNDTPVAHTAIVTLNEDSTKTIPLIGSDIDGDPLNVRLVSLPVRGTLVQAGNDAFRYIPQADFNGSDSFRFVVNDGQVDSIPATINIVVNPVNDAPVIENITSQSLDEDTVISIPVNVSDVDSSLSDVSLSCSSDNSDVLPCNSDDITGTGSNRALALTPISNASGIVSITVAASDSINGTSRTFTVTVNAVNDAPVAQDFAVNMDEDSTETFPPVASDVDGDVLSQSFTTLPLNGKVDLVNGNFVYTPASDFSGSDSFTYTVSDGHGGASEPATVTINVFPINDAPTLGEIASQSFDEDTQHTVAINVTDVDSPISNVSLGCSSDKPEVLTCGPGNLSGTTNIRTLTLSPAMNIVGTAAITLTVDDGTLSSSKTFTATVNAVNDAPVAEAIEIAMDEDSTVTIAPVASDVDGDPLTASVSTAPGNGTVGIVNGQFVYTPNPDFNGSDSFTYIVRDNAPDGAGTSAPATVTITINPINDAPVFSSFSAPPLSVAVGGLYAFRAYATDQEDDSLTFSVINQPEWLNFDTLTGELSGIPAASHLGVYSNIIIRVSDGNGGSAELPPFDINVVAELVTIEITNPGNDTSQGYGDITVTANVSDESQTARVYFQINNGQWQEDTDGSPWSMTFSEVHGGVNSLQARVINSSGVESYSEIHTVTLTTDYADRVENIEDLEVRDAALNAADFDEAEATNTDYYGAVDAEGGVSGGAASYHIPIVVPPGRNNLAPNVSVNYSSRAGAGVLGVGWQLSAFDTISRCGAIADIDGFTSNVSFDASTDKLCYGGERLIVTNAEDYGTDGAVYRTEIDQFTRITQTSNLNSGTVSFTVEHKNGIVDVFDGTRKSKLSPEGKTQTLTWGLSSRSDQHGNRIEYSYNNYTPEDEDEDFYPNQLIITKITYTLHDEVPSDAKKRSVQFTYDNLSASQASYAYIAGGKTESAARLTNIQTYVGTELVRDYQFEFTSSTANGRLLLDNINLCVENGVKCTSTTSVATFNSTLNWNTPQRITDVTDTWEFENTEKLNNPNRYLMRDIDGDGLSEMIAMHIDISAGSVQGINAKVLRLNNAGSYSLEETFTGDGASALISGVTGDLNEDGITDFIAYQGSQLVLYQYDNEDNELDSSNLGHTLSAGYTNLNSTNTHVMDLNGDGVQDIVLSNYLINGKKQVGYYKGNLDGGIQNSFQLIYEQESRSGDSNITIHESMSWQDINGDGIQDAVLSYSPSETYDGRIGYSRIHIRLGQINAGNFSLGSARDAGQTNLPENVYYSQYTFADLNGDGLKDFVFAKGDVTTAIVDDEDGHGWYVQINTGDGNFADEASLGSTTGIHSWSDKFERKPGDGFVTYDPEHLYRTQARFGGLVVGDFDVDGQDELLVATEAIDEFCVLLTGWKTDVQGNPYEEFEIDSCNDQIQKSNHIDKARTGDPRETSANLSQYDLRRFNWTLLDFRSNQGNDNPVLYQEYEDIVSAPLSNSVFYHGQTIQSLSNHDFNNDGYLDLAYQTLTGGVFTDSNYSAGGYYITQGAVSGRFTTSEPESGVFVQSFEPLVATESEETTESESTTEGRLVDMVWKIDDGIGNVHQWVYSNISTPETNNGRARYTVPADRNARYVGDFTRDYFYFTSSMPIVTTYKAPNGNGGHNDYEYYYNEAVFNRKGRGFQGFRSIYIDNPDGTRSETDFHQVFPLTGKIEQTRVCEVPTGSTECTGGLIRVTDVSYLSNDDNDTTSSGTKWALAVDTTETQYALNSDSQVMQKNTTITTSTLNAEYGQVSNVETTIDDGFGTTTKTTTTDFDNTFVSDDIGEWWINKVNTITVTNSAKTGDSRDVYTQNSSLDAETQVLTTYTYTGDDDEVQTEGTKERLLDTVTVSVVSGEGKSTTTDYDYTTAGAIDSITLQSPGETDRVQSFTYGTDDTDSEYYFPDQITNAEGHTTTVVTNKTYGQPTSQTDANEVTTTLTYDGFGRLTSKATPMQPTTYLSYRKCEGCDYKDTDKVKYSVRTTAHGSPTNEVYFDSLGRNRLTETEHFTGSVFVRTTYDDLGRITFQSQPANSGNLQYGTTFSRFDLLGRPQNKTVSQASDTDLNIAYTYHADNNAHKTTIVAGSLTMHRTYSGIGLLMQTTDALDGVTQYAYDGRNNPIVIRDANSNDIKAKYNALSQKIEVNDPNQGESTYTYTGFGELHTHTDAKNQTRTWSYDELGRQFSMEATSGESWSKTFDTATRPDDADDTETCLGQLASQERGTFTESYSYDEYCRLVSTSTDIKGSSYTTHTLYDGNYGRPKAMIYPDDLVVGFSYNAKGMLTSIYNVQSNYVYQSIEAMDVYGNWTQASVAGSIAGGEMNYAGSIIRNYYPQTGQMENSEFRQNDDALQRVAYTYADYGNLSKQTVTHPRDSASSYVSIEDYDYDYLHRLDDVTSSYTVENINCAEGQSDCSEPQGQFTVDYAYDAVGNIKKKTDFSEDIEGAYVYGTVGRSNGNAGPNAVREVNLGNDGGKRTYSYDLNGNLTNDGLRTINYNVDNLPISIALTSGYINPVLDDDVTGTSTATFGYTPDLVHYLQEVTDGNGREIHYVGKHYEKIKYDNGLVEKRFYIGDVAILTKRGDSKTLGITHKDRLGSSIGIADAGGNLRETHSFDAFGRPRQGSFGIRATQIFDSEFTNQGFTGHEQLNDVQLTHMNGRVYDYNLGRFLSVDPFIQSPTNTQSMNPYSYIMNNPLAGTDPSGYSACGDMLSKRRCEPMTFDKVMAGTSRSTMAGSRIDHANVTRFIAMDNGRATTALASSASQNNSRDVANIEAQGRVATADDFGQSPKLKGWDSNFGDIANGTETASLEQISNTNSSPIGNGEEVESELSESMGAKLKDPRFRNAVFSALGFSKKEVMRLRSGSLGIAVKSDGEGGYNLGDFPNNSPNTNILRGLEDRGGAATALYEVTDAKAVAIGVPGHWRTKKIINRSYFYKDLSNRLGAPVFVGGVKSKVVIYDGNNSPVIFNPRKHL